MSCSKLYNAHSAAFIAPESITTTSPLIVFKASVYKEILAQQAALAVPDDELPHKTPAAKTADYQCGVPKELKRSTTENGLVILECIEENKKTGFAIIICPSSKQALVAFGRRTLSNWCEYPVESCCVLSRWNEADFKAACATVFLDDPNNKKVMIDIFMATEPSIAQKATSADKEKTKGIANFDSVLWDSKAVRAMYDSLLLRCTNKDFYDTLRQIADIIRTELELESLVGAVKVIESNPFDGLWGNKLQIRDFVDAVTAVAGPFDLLSAAEEGFAGRAGKNQLGMVMTAIMHTVCEIGFNEFLASVHTLDLVVVRDD